MNLQTVLNISHSVLFCGLDAAQRSSRSLYRRDGSCTGSSLTGDDVHELHLRFQPHSSQTPLSRLWQGEYPTPQEVRHLISRNAANCRCCSLVLLQIVCRSCCRNRYPLKYMKDRMAKVCDRCYSELKKRGQNTNKQKVNMTIMLKPYFSKAIHL